MTVSGDDARRRAAGGGDSNARLCKSPSHHGTIVSHCCRARPAISRSCSRTTSQWATCSETRPTKYKESLEKKKKEKRCFSTDLLLARDLAYRLLAGAAAANLITTRPCQLSAGGGDKVLSVAFHIAITRRRTSSSTSNWSKLLLDESYSSIPLGIFFFVRIIPVLLYIYSHCIETRGQFDDGLLLVSSSNRLKHSCCCAKAGCETSLYKYKIGRTGCVANATTLLHGGLVTRLRNAVQQHWRKAEKTYEKRNQVGKCCSVYGISSKSARIIVTGTLQSA